MSKIRSEFPQTPLNLTLREEQISIILCALENSVKYADSDYIEEVDEIFEVLETTVDKFYNKIEKARAKRPEEEWYCLLYTSPSPRDWMVSRMPSSA